MPFLKPPRPYGPAGALLYVIGDIHGRSDLLHAMLEIIRQDLIKVGARQPPTLIFLGDYIDRGPDARGVLDRMIALKDDPRLDVVTLRGNHEAFLLSFLENPMTAATDGWLDHGGRDTLKSYRVPIPARRLSHQDWARTAIDLEATMPAEHLAFIRETTFTASYGSYVFVHAGVRPGVTLNNQLAPELLNIREPFLRHRRPIKDRVVVFGHSVFEKPLIEEGKIGLDTGAFASGRLTAMKIDGAQREFFQT